MSSSDPAFSSHRVLETASSDVVLPIFLKRSPTDLFFVAILSGFGSIFLSLAPPHAPEDAVGLQIFRLLWIAVFVISVFALVLPSRHGWGILLSAQGIEVLPAFWIGRRRILWSDVAAFERDLFRRFLAGVSIRFHRGLENTDRGRVLGWLTARTAFQLPAVDMPDADLIALLERLRVQYGNSTITDTSQG